MAFTITATTLSQSVAGGTVAVSFTATDAASRTLNLSYRYRAHGTTDWLVPTTTLPDTVSATPGGASVSGTWEINDDVNTDVTSASFDFEVVATSQQAVASTGSATVLDANATTGVRDGDTIVIAGRTYEFNTTGGVTAGNVAVPLAGVVDTQANVKAALLAAVNADTQASVHAVANAAAGRVDFTYAVPGIIGNIAITKTAAVPAAITVTGLTGGLDIETVTSDATVTATTNAGISVPEDADSDLPLPGQVDPENFQHDELRILELEGHVDRYGAVAQGNMNWSFAKSCLNDLESGKRWVIQIFRDRNDPEPRAMLVNPDIYEKVVGSNDPNLVAKDVPWFINTAYRNLTSLFRDHTVYRVNSTVIPAIGPVAHRKNISSKVVAYLMSYEDWKLYLG